MRSPHTNSQGLNDSSMLDDLSMENWNEQRLTSRFISSTKKQLLLTFSEGSYIINYFIVIFYLIYAQNTQVIVTLAISQTYFNLFAFGIVQAVSQVTDKVTLKMLNNFKYRETNLILRQSLYIVILLGIFVVLPFTKIVVPPIKLTPYTQVATIQNLESSLNLLIIPTVLRCLNTTAKSWFKIMGHSNIIGLISIFFQMLYLGYSYCIMVCIGMGIQGVAICFTIFEILNFMMLIYLYYYKLDERSRDSKLWITSKLQYLSLDSCIRLLKTYHLFVSYEFLFGIIILTNDDNQIEGFMFLRAFSDLIVLVSKLCIPFPKGMIIDSLKEGWSTRSKVYFICFSIFLAVVYSGIGFFCFYILDTYGQSSTNASDTTTVPTSMGGWISYCVSSYSLNLTLSMIFEWVQSIMFCYRLKGIQFCLLQVFNYLVRIPLTYWLVFYLGFQLEGVFYAEIICQLKLVLMLYVILRKKWIIKPREFFFYKFNHEDEDEKSFNMDGMDSDLQLASFGNVES